MCCPSLGRKLQLVAIKGRVTLAYLMEDHVRRSMIFALVLTLMAGATPALAIGNGPKGPCSGPPCPVAHKLPTPRAAGLCKQGKLCGHSCIPRNKVCHGASGHVGAVTLRWNPVHNVSR